MRLPLLVGLMLPFVGVVRIVSGAFVKITEDNEEELEDVYGLLVLGV